MSLSPALRQASQPLWPPIASHWVEPARTAPPSPGLTPEIILDLSRLLSRVLHTTPTGIDRVEMAYARTLLRIAPERLSFAAVHPGGLYVRLSSRAARAFLDDTEERWSHGGGKEGDRARWSRAVWSNLRLASPRMGRPDPLRPRVYLHLSPRALERTALFAAVLRWERARLIAFVHDLIPLQFPEYARARGPELFRRKLATLTRLASGFLVNSQATASALQSYLDAAASRPPVRVAPLGVGWRAGEAQGPGEDAYFVCLGTIEPRKNHLLLLNLWRELAAGRPAEAAPKLILVGRRGWENETVLNLLERSPTLQAVVVERQGLSDDRLKRLIQGARAVLMPSFAEGYGLPVAEALALGTPVIASDLPALREAGGDAPDYLDPLDGPAWRQAVMDYADPQSPRRRAQLARLRRWRAPDWESPVRVALDLAEAVWA